MTYTGTVYISDSNNPSLSRGGRDIKDKYGPRDIFSSVLSNDRTSLTMRSASSRCLSLHKSKNRSYQSFTKTRQGTVPVLFISSNGNPLINEKLEQRWGVGSTLYILA